ncbi:ammonia permease [Bacillus cereus group sp. BfR-BA-01380]|uniref:ammonia permease n=1 Tax=Bacillus cereus group sp. BfR-BA-01380 TaxID=2920324 RepID=UPI001F58CEDE|nr:ammonia permease [Bacillus cereus group sp. BfR-BA-01380]
MQIFVLLWICFVPVLVLCGIGGGLFFMIKGIAHKKLLILLMGIVCFSLVLLPIIFAGIGKDVEQSLPLSTSMYWGLLAIASLLAGISGARHQMTSIKRVGITVCLLVASGIFFHEMM